MFDHGHSARASRAPAAGARFAFALFSVSIAAFLFLGLVLAREARCAGGNPEVVPPETGLVRFWIGTGDGSSWSDPANWTPSGVPAPDDSVFIQAAVPDTVVPGFRGRIEVILEESAAVERLTIDSGPWTVSLVLRDDTLTVGGELLNRGLLVIEQDAALALPEGAVLTNMPDGEIRLVGGSVVGDGRLVNGGLVVKIDPPGIERAFSTMTVEFDNQFDDPGDGAIVVEGGVLIMQGELTNDGTAHVTDGSLWIEGAATNSGSITLDPGTEALFDPADGPVSGLSLSSDGLIVLEEGAVFSFPDADDGLENSPGGLILLRGGTLLGPGFLGNGGVIRAEGEGALRSVRSTIEMPGDNRQQDPGDGAITAGDGAVLALQDDLLNHGEITVEGGGELAVEPGAKDASHPVLTNEGLIDIEPGGTFTNASEVEVGLPGIVRIGGTASVEPEAAWVQRGRTILEENASLTIRADGRVAGVFENRGVLELGEGASVENLGSFLHEENGILAGVGTVDNSAGAFLAEGIFKPGDPVGILTLVGDLVLGGMSEVWVHLAGTVPGEGYDRLFVEGAVTTAGALKVGLIGFEPELGDRFDVIEGTGGTILTSIGCYGGLDLPGGLYLQPLEESGGLALVTVDSIAANAAPEAAFDVGSTDAGVPVVLELLLNDVDEDGDPLRIVGLGTVGTAGFVTIDGGDSSVTYTPAAAFVGADAFRYAVTDCRGGIDSALVTVHVSSEPRLWFVPGDAPTIAAGIDSAFPGDTVVVACGTYPEHDLAVRSGVVLRSQDRLAGCAVIDAEGAGRGLLCDGVDAGTVIEGFTIAAGAADRGAGLLCRNGSSPELRRVALVGGAASGEGGGFASDASSRPVFRQATFAGNRADALGGGFHLEGEAVLDRVILWGNGAPGGASAYLEAGSKASFTSADVESAGVEGPGLATYDAPTIYEDPVFCGATDPEDAPAAEGDFRIDHGSPCFAVPPSAIRGAYGAGCLGHLTFDEEWFGEDPPGGLQTSVEEAEGGVLGARFDVHPNPSSGSVTIAFSRPAGAGGALRVYDVAGRLVRAYALASNAGSISWDGTNTAGARVAPGVYFVRLATGNATETKRVTLIR
ncbi:MAG: Ig-like domain-containing protein [Candidatus Eisenbacteria bacterium]